ncbi:MAG: threonine synthase [Rhodospirillales bacterium]|nr:threonine synthase [Rhodospirillales bacterium]
MSENVAEYKMRASGFVCLGCRHAHELSLFTYECERCGWPLSVSYSAGQITQSTARNILISARHMWDFFDFLPVDRRDRIVDLGEGGTPLLHASVADADVNGATVFVKNETLNPTGAFKDRPLSVILSMAKQQGMERVVTGSSGNAGVSMSAYAARAGLKAIVIVPRTTPREKVLGIKAFGAQVIQIDGNCSDALSLANGLSAKQGWLCASTTYRNPFGLEGDKTVAYELLRDLDFQAPTHVFVPIGSGPLLTGCYRGFQDLVRWGLIDEIPRMIGVQAEGCAPVTAAFEEGTERVRAWENSDTIATGIADELRGYEFDGILTIRTVRKSGGVVLSVSDQQIVEAQKNLAESWGVFAEPTGAVGLAGLRKYGRIHGLSHDDRAVCIVTGSGFKDPCGITRFVNTENLSLVEPSLEALEHSVS